MKKLLISFLCVVMVMVFMPTMAFAASGAGTAANPHVVANEADLEAAFANGGYIKVGGDFELTKPQTVAKGQTVTLDLAGHTISQTLSENPGKNYSMITNNGTLTINDSVGSGKITFAYTGEATNWSSCTNTISNTCATLTVNGGTIENTTNVSNHMYYAIDSLTNGGLGVATLNINGGTVSCKNYRAIRQFANSTTQDNILNITDGTVSCDYVAIFVQNANYAADGKATLNISGGTVDRIYLYQIYSEAFNMSVTGGTFTGHGTKTQTEGYAGASNKDIVIDAYPEGNSNIVKNFISGGVFSDTPSTDNLIDGYKAYEKDGKFVVGLDFVPPTVDAGTEEVPTAPTETTVKNEMNTVITDIVTGAGTTAVNEDTAKNIMDAITENPNVEIKTEVVVDEVKAENVAKAEADAVKAVVKDDAKVGQYFDLSLVIKAGENELGTLDKLANKIKFTLDIPKALQDAKNVFTIVRVHEGKAEVLPTTVDTDNWTVTFETDRFSTYALTYTTEAPATETPETGKTDNDTPKTGDMNTMLPWLAVMALAAGAAVVLKKKED